MQIFRTLAGYSYARADLVRRAMSKKKADVLAAERRGFCDGAVAHGVPLADAERIFDRMQSFAEYAFNKSHAAAYATLSFRTAYLKAHHRSEYMAALLTSVLGDLPKTAEYIGECTRAGIAVLPPDINESRMTFSVVDGNIRFGLLALKNVGRPFVAAILAEREKRPFADFCDFLERMSGRDMNKRQVESLIKAGAFDRLGTYRSRLLSSYEAMMEEHAARARSNVSGQIDIFSMDSADAIKAPAHFSYPDIPEFTLRELLLLEKESSGMYFSGHVIDEYAGALEAKGCTPILEILKAFSENEEGDDRFSDGVRITVGGVITRRSNKNLKNGTTMSIVTLEDRYGEIDAVVFSKTLDTYGKHLSQENAVAVTGKLSVREGQRPEIVVYSAEPLSEAEAPKKSAVPKRLFLRVRSLDADECRAAVSLLERHSGDMEVALYDRSAERYVTVTGRRVSASDELLNALYRILGRENVVCR